MVRVRLHPLDFRDALQLLANGTVPAGRLITGEVGLPGVAAGFDALATPRSHARILIDPRSDVARPQQPRPR